MIYFPNLFGVDESFEVLKVLTELYRKHKKRLRSTMKLLNILILHRKLFTIKIIL